MYTFVYAKGYSYLSDDPMACANCRIVNEQYDGWLKSSHKGVATCYDCRTPHARQILHKSFKTTSRNREPVRKAWRIRKTFLRAEASNPLRFCPCFMLNFRQS